MYEVHCVLVILPEYKLLSQALIWTSKLSPLLPPLTCDNLLRKCPTHCPSAIASLFLADSEILELLQPTRDNFDMTFSEEWWEQFGLLLRRSQIFPGALKTFDSFFYSETALLLCLCLILQNLRGRL